METLKVLKNLLVAVLVTVMVIVQVATSGFILVLRLEIFGLEQRVAALEQMKPLAFTVGCAIGGTEYAPPEVMWPHPEVKVNSWVFPFYHWIEVVVRDEDGTKSYLVGSSAGSSGETYLEGWVPSVLGGHAILNSHASYTLRIWRHGYETYPQFQPNELVYEADFKVPDCK